MLRTVARGPLPWLSGLIVIYLGVPVAAFVVRLAGSDRRGFGTPGLFPAFFVSLESATISLAIVTVLGLPLAYLLARRHGPVAAAVGMVVQLPLALPPLMCGILLVYLVGPYTYLGQLSGERLTMTLTGIVLAQTFVSAPFLIVAARAAFGSVDPGLLDVAATLGHGDLARFGRVAVPVAAPGIRAGMLLAWLRAFGEYGAVVVLAYHPFSLPVFTYDQFSGVGLPTTLAPTALALAVALVAVAVAQLHPRRDHRRPVVPPRPGPPGPVRPAPVGFTIDHHVGSFHLSLAHRAGHGRLAILGPSGAGKSALLRCLAGLSGPAHGQVWYGERPVTRVPVERRGVGYVAQGFPLFPHMTVWGNLMFAEGATPPIAAYWLEHLHLHGLADRYPHQLSGGQRQRAALAQALCRSASLLLLDEPFTALDAPVRRELRLELRRLQVETGLSTVLVTHDAEEAAMLSDEIIVVADGVALQSGTVRQVFSRPASPDVARLLGIANLNRGTVVTAGEVETGGLRITADTAALAPGTEVLWSIPPERIELVAAGGLPGALTDVTDMGTSVELSLTVGASLGLRMRSPDPGTLRVGQPCHVALPPRALTLWRASQAPAGESLTGPQPTRGDEVPTPRRRSRSDGDDAAPEDGTAVEKQRPDGAAGL